MDVPPSDGPAPLTPLYIVIPGPILLDDRLSDKSKLLYGVLAWLADDGGRVWLSARRVAVTLGLELRRTRMLFGELRDADHIALDTPSVPGVKPNIWRLTTLHGRQKIAGGVVHKTASTPGKKLLSEEDKGEKSSSSRTRLSDAIEEVIAPYLVTATFPESVRGTIRGTMLGLNFHPAATEAEIVAAIHEMQVGNVATFGARVFRGYVKRVRAGETSGTGTTGTRAPGLGAGLRQLRGGKA